jgi:uncharacterized membrane protein YqjE
MMLQFLLNLAGDPSRQIARRLATPVILSGLALLFFIIGMVALLLAVFHAIAPENGPVAAAGAVSGIALVLALIALLPVILGQRRS